MDDREKINPGPEYREGDDAIFASILQTTLESTADGILVVNREGKIVSYNQKFRKMWNIPVSVMRRQNDEEAIQFVLDQLRDPEGFVKKLTKLYTEPETDCFDEIEFKDGRIYERYSIPQRLGDEIIGRVFSFRDVTNRKKMEADMIRQANYDPLTGLPNRSCLMDQISQDIKYAKRNKEKLAVLFLDLDRFKNVNDSLGHDLGDHLLQAAAKRIQNCIRDEDTLARWGGDEFIILLPHLTQEEDVVSILERCKKVLEEVFTIRKHDISISASIGVSFYPKDGTDPVTLLKNADSAMYSAKYSGRNSYCFYTSQMNEKAVEHLSLAHDLHNALDKKEFFLQYQPIIDLKSGMVVSVEALLRWRNEKRGLIGPIDFIPLLEETGLIHKVGEWVLFEACRQNKEWQDRGIPPVRVSVNFSTLQFNNQDLTDVISQTLKKTGLLPEYLDCEITESGLMQNFDGALELMGALSKIGVTFSIDDFGTGYSSLSYLKRFPVQKVKIDRSFIRDILKDEDDSALVEAIIAMAQKLKLKIVAEGVETIEQVEFLKECLCDEIQGYIFSPPINPEDCAKLIENKTNIYEEMKKIIETTDHHCKTGTG